MTPTTHPAATTAPTHQLERAREQLTGPEPRYGYCDCGAEAEYPYESHDAQCARYRDGVR